MNDPLYEMFKLFRAWHKEHMVGGDKYHEFLDIWTELYEKQSIPNGTATENPPLAE